MAFLKNEKGCQWMSAHDNLMSNFLQTWNCACNPQIPLSHHTSKVICRLLHSQDSMISDKCVNNACFQLAMCTCITHAFFYHFSSFTLAQSSCSRFTSDQTGIYAPDFTHKLLLKQSSTNLVCTSVCFHFERTTLNSQTVKGLRWLIHCSHCQGLGKGRLFSTNIQRPSTTMGTLMNDHQPLWVLK